MILWINGPFGAGKTTLAREIVSRHPDVHFFDTETVGYLLRPVLDEPRPVRDFQDWRAWRKLVVEAIAAIHEELGGTIVVPQSVYVEQYWNEIYVGLTLRDVAVRAVTLSLPTDELERRIRADRVETSAVAWRLEHMTEFAALPWLESTNEFLDATRPPAELAAELGY